MKINSTCIISLTLILIANMYAMEVAVPEVTSHPIDRLIAHNKEIADIYHKQCLLLKYRLNEQYEPLLENLFLIHAESEMLRTAADVDKNAIVSNIEEKINKITELNIWGNVTVKKTAMLAIVNELKTQQTEKTKK